jgi:indolepyruvate ferredoxin oxidoreductase, beta subunit
MKQVTNIKVAGLGGMGVLSAAGVLGEVVFRAGHDVKKAEVHGMSQRGGSLCSDVRFGAEVHSPMIPPGEVDFLIALDEEWKHLHRHELRPGGVMLSPADIDTARLPSKKALNVAMLGALSRHLPELAESLWLEVLREGFPEKLHAANEAAFRLGRGERSHAPTDPNARLGEPGAT